MCVCWKNLFHKWISFYLGPYMIQMNHYKYFLDPPKPQVKLLLTFQNYMLLEMFVQ